MPFVLTQTLLLPKFLHIASTSPVLITYMIEKYIHLFFFHFLLQLNICKFLEIDITFSVYILTTQLVQKRGYFIPNIIFHKNFSCYFLYLYLIMPNFIFHHFINSPLNLYPIPHTFKNVSWFCRIWFNLFLILRIMPITLSSAP